jgi:N-acetylated-alpha-linked acidic dipeptidase
MMGRRMSAVSTLEEAILDEISQGGIMRDIAALTQWDRTAGTPGAREAALYVREQLQAEGIQTAMYTFKGYISVPGPARVEVESPVRRACAAKTFSFAASTPPGGVSGELVFIDWNLDLMESLERPLEFDWATLKGKIALVNGLPIPAVADQIQRAGAAGAVFTSTNGRTDEINEFILTNIWGTPATNTAHLLPKLSATNVSQADSRWLRGMVEKGPVRLRFWASVDTGWRDLYLPVATIEGGSDDFVLLHDHLCSWHLGATDNAAANAATMELARRFQRRRADLRRSIKIGWWPAHSQGRYAGSAWYADNCWGELDRHAVATLNGDLWGMHGASHYSTVNVSELTDFIQDVMREVTGHEQPMLRPNRHSDESFLFLGIPSMMLRHTIPGEERPWYWHCETDTLDKVDSDVIVDEARVAARILARLTTAAVLPYRFAKLAAQVSERVLACERDAEGLLSMQPAIEAARRFHEAAGCTDEVLDRAVSDRRAGDINQHLKAVTRALNPVLYTVSGRYHPDDAYPMEFIPGLSRAKKLSSMDVDARGFAVTYLVRERTRLVDALNRASDLLEQLNAPGH